MDLLHDTPLGHIIRYLAGGRIQQLRFYEELNPEIWRRYVAEPEEGRGSSAGTSRADDAPEQDQGPSEVSGVSGIAVDSEKGTDRRLVDFLPNDPEVGRGQSMNTTSGRIMHLADGYRRIPKTGLFPRSSSSPLRYAFSRSPSTSVRPFTPRALRMSREHSASVRSPAFWDSRCSSLGTDSDR